MVAWFVIAIATIGLFGYMAFAGVQAVSVTGDGVARAEAVNRVEKAAAALIARASPGDDGALYLPAGQINNGVYGLPEDMQAMGATPFGPVMVYCPFGGTGTGQTSTQNVRMPSGMNYDVGIRTISDKSFVVSGRPATIAGTTADPNLLGFVIAPASRGAALQGCDAITLTGNTYDAPNSIVRPILRNPAAEAARRSLGEGSAYYVTVAGGGDGLSPSSPGTLAQAIDFWRTHPVMDFRIHMKDGTHSLAANALNVGQPMTGDVAHPDGAKISFIGTDGTKANVIVSQAGATLIRLDADLQLYNLTFAPESVLQVSGHDLALANATVGRVYASQNAQIVGRGAVDVTSNVANDYGVWLESGARLNAEGTFTVNYAAGQLGIRIRPGASATFSSSAVSLQPRSGGTLASGIYVDKNAKVDFRDASLNLNGNFTYGLVAAGEATLYNTPVNVNAGGHVAVQAEPNGAVTLWLSPVGGTNPANYGVSENKSRLVRGLGNSLITARINCWISVNGGRLFTYSGSPTTSGSYATPSNDEVLPVLSATPTAAEVQAYEQVQLRNAERQIIRLRNTADWRCSKI